MSVDLCVLNDLRHHGSEAFVLDRSRRYEQGPSFKPRGLWISVDNAWARWCRDEELSGADWVGQRVYSVTLDAAAKLLVLSSPAELDSFTNEYGVKSPYDRAADRRYHFIDWPTVADRYAGIIIAPYIWERRLDLMWYYGWDAASGCVWDLDAVIGVGPEGKQ